MADRIFGIVEGSPAWEAGLRDGDEVRTVDGRALDVLWSTSGPMGSEVTLGVEGPDGPYEVTLTREHFPTEDDCWGP